MAKDAGQFFPRVFICHLQFFFGELSEHFFTFQAGVLKGRMAAAAGVIL
jgi:hypothetical protein